MCGLVTLKPDVERTEAQSLFIITHTFGGIKLIKFAGDMKHCRFSRPVSFVRFPVTWKTATNSNHSSQHVWMRKREPVVERAALGKAQEEYLVRIGRPFRGQCVYQIKQRLMMDCDRVLRLE